jgi:hypothetical protein
MVASIGLILTPPPVFNAPPFNVHFFFLTLKVNHEQESPQVPRILPPKTLIDAEGRQN